MAQLAPSCPVFSLSAVAWLEQLLAASGYERIERSRLGDQAGHVSLWEGRHLYVILIGRRVVVGPLQSNDWRVRTTLEQLDESILQMIREDNGEAVGEEEQPESGTWLIGQRAGNQ